MFFAAFAALDGLVALGIRKKNHILSDDLFNLVTVAMITTIFYIGSFSFENYRISSVCSTFYFIGVDAILVLMLQFVLDFSEFPTQGAIGTALQVGFIWLIADMLMLLVNPFREIVISYVPVEVGGHVLYDYDAHFLYDLHLVLCYAMAALIVGMLIYRIARTPKIYAGKYTAVLLVFLLVLFLNVLYLVGAEYFQLDISVLFYSLASFLIYSVVFSSMPRSILNQTRNYVMDNMDAPVLVFDYEDRIIDSNRRARQLFPELTPEQQNTRDAVDVARYFHEKGFPPLDKEKTEFEWQYHTQNEERRYHCRRHDFLDHKNRLIGRMLMLHDISYQKDPITGLDRTPGLYRYLGSLNRELNYPIQILSVNVNGLGLINSALGHDKGNLIMERTSEIMQAVVGRNVYMAKLEDGTLVAILLKTPGKRAVALGQEIRALVRQETSMGFRFDVEYGLSEINESVSDLFEALQESEQSLKNRKLLSGNSHESPIINSLTQTLLESDYETEAHVERTKIASQMLAASLNLTDREASSLELLCMLHDVGKVGIPTEILLKPGKLTADEWEIMKTHAEKGYRIAMASPELQSIAQMILHHHERWDGGGYPGKLKEKEIPLLSRIITVLDSFDVMTHDRPYHKAISVEDAKAELVRCSGSQFDPAIVDAFLPIADQVFLSGQQFI